MAREPIAGMVENAVPTQLDQDDLVAEVDSSRVAKRWVMSILARM